MIFFSIDSQKNEKLSPEQPTRSFQKTQDKREGEGLKVIKNEEELLNKSFILNELTNSGTKIEIDSLPSYIVNNFNNIKEKFSSEFFKCLTGYSKNEIEKNLKYDEFKKNIEKEIKKKIRKLPIEDEIDLRMLLYLKDLDILDLKETFSHRKGKIKGHYGEEIDVERYKNHAYRQIDIRKTIKELIRHNKTKIEDITKNDIVVKTFGTTQENLLYILLDCSSSMSGKKIHLAKKAALSVSYKATSEKNRTGFIAFNNQIITHIKLTKNFYELLKTIISISPFGRTNISNALKLSVEELARKQGTKHIILISDALETEDFDKVYDAASIAKSEKITISIIGTELNEQGKKLSQDLVNITEGKYYQFVLEDLEKIVLEDYYSFY
ncbi:MAG: vWA domain-containing protein [Candidatus Woesearchaeota archaeon]